MQLLAFMRIWAMQHLTAGGNAKMHNTHNAHVSDTIFHHLHLWTGCQKKLTFRMLLKPKIPDKN